ncbi:MAG: PD-(D/E)XK nuclease family protein [bacterium]|nr:PD-(D/E)XK nuclease family protein [bacterium]MDZ4231907.1 PD-(D/E)XK nuclease family protein [Candidatus Pacearchaeota archaeon]
MDKGFQERYGYEIDGMWLPRVTAITSQSLSRSSYLEHRLKYSAQWGSEVHEGVERMLKGEEEKEEDATRISLDAFRSWMEQSHCRVLNPEEDVEVRVVDFEEGYAGTIDMVAEVAGRLGVVDVKTTSAVTRQHRLQTAAYLAALRKERGIEADGRWILRIDQYQLCLGCEARITAKYGNHRPQGGHESCNHQWGEARAESELTELTNFEQDLEGFLDAKERWEWANRFTLAEIPGYQKSVFTRIFV